MIRWLHRFFYSDDPEVRLIAALSEPEAEMRRELLENNGIPSVIKNVSSLYYHLGRHTSPLMNNFDMFVKKSDLELAREVLGPIFTSGDADQAT